MKHKADTIISKFKKKEGIRSTLIDKLIVILKEHKFSKLLDTMIKNKIVEIHEEKDKSNLKWLSDDVNRIIQSLR